MRKLIYHVATTLDHYIAHEDHSIDGFLPEGDHITDYVASLQNYDTVIMGKATYEFGYQYGIQPGQPAYPNMKHYVFSKTLHFNNPHEQVKVVNTDTVAFVQQLKAQEGTDIYLCGGGNFAGFLLEHELIDELKIKLNPVIFGKGIPLFGNSKKNVSLEFIHAKMYDSGVLLLSYRLKYD